MADGKEGSDAADQAENDAHKGVSLKEPSTLENLTGQTVLALGGAKVTQAGIVEMGVALDVREFERARRAAHKALAGGPMREKKRRVAGGQDPTDAEGFAGPWAGFEGERKGREAVVQPEEEEVYRYQRERAQILPATLAQVISLGQERSIFHGREERDHLGHTYMTPSDANAIRAAGSFACHAPRRLIHTWTGHTKGVNAIRFLPTTGHLLLSAGQDQRIKLWSVQGTRECLRTFYGHNKPVREVDFGSDGRAFVSCSYDKTFKVWDTESGKCTFYKDHRAVPYCARLHPRQEALLLVGTEDRKVLQFDLRSGKQVVEHRGHRGAVNSITFFNDDANFVTSSDDKSLRIWELRRFRPLKVITGPDLASMPCAAVHPTEPFVVFQSLANQLAVYAQQDYLVARNRRFGGHLTGGYPCQISFSPDGRFICSGDGRGQVVVWEWESGQIARRIDAHHQVSIGVEWNPREPSRLATCSWDGTIKYWE